MADEIIDGNFSSKKVVLCFSGGGLRATFYHLGVFKALRELGLHKNITQIYSVSGGSILTAHALLNWERYTGSDKEFAAVTDELCQFGSRDIRTRVVNRYLAGIPLTILSWLFPLARFVPIERYFGRSQTLEAEYRALVGNANLRQLRGGNNNFPQLYMLTTSFSSGTACAFTHNGLISDVRDPKGSLNETGNIPVSKAIAASSAFPPLFPPVKITRDSVNGELKPLMSREVFLTDGGVYDNLGLDVAKMMYANTKSALDQYMFVVSDASAPFSHDDDSNFSDLISRTVRTTDILMNRVTESARRAILTDTNDAIIHLNITKKIEDEGNSVLPRDIQILAARIRTDLDFFSDFEKEILIQRGYEVGRDIMKSTVEPRGNTDLLTRLNETNTFHKAIKTLRKSMRRRLFRPIFSDKFFWVLVVYFILLVGFPVTSILKSYYLSVDNIASLESTVERQRGTLDALESSFSIQEISDASLPEIDQRYRADFKVFMQENGVKRLDPDDLLVLGKSQKELGSAALIKNAYPPRFAWSNIVPAANGLDRLAQDLGEVPEIISTYRTPDYNDVVSDTHNSRHLLFNAIDFRFKQGTPSSWAQALRDYRTLGVFTGGIGVSTEYVHIDGRGTVADWVVDTSKATVPTLDAVRPAYKIFIQFAGFNRPQIVELGTELHDLGWDVPSFDRGGERTINAIGYSEVRFGPETSRWVVDELVKEVSESTLGLEVKLVETPIIPSGIIEIWISQ